MKVNDIHQFVNDVTGQAYGETALAVLDNTGLVALGDTVFSSQTNLDAFVNAFVDKIGKVIFSSRKYTRRQKRMIRDLFEYGAIMQKLYTEPYKAVANPKYDLTDGQSVDQYIVSKPAAKQKLFDGVNNFEIRATIWGDQLQSAFTSFEMMAAYIDSVFVTIENSLDAELENLENMTVANFIGEKLAYSVSTGATGVHVINCLQEYNTASDRNLTAAAAWVDPEFWRWFGKVFRLTMKYMEKMSKKYNTQGYTRFTPIEYQTVQIHAQALEAVDTYLQSDTFHNEFTALPGGEEVLYWQAPGTGIDAIDTGDSTAIDIVTSSGVAVKQDGIIALITDIEAMGMMINKPRVTTSPYNADGEYTNYFYKQELRYFNDLSENGVVFTLTDNPFSSGDDDDDQGGGDEPAEPTALKAATLKATKTAKA